MGQVRGTRSTLLVGGIKIGGGKAVKAINQGTVAIDPASIAANTRGTVVVSLAGVGISVGDVVQMTPPAALDAGLLYGGCYVSNTDEVTIFLLNYTAGAVDGASRTWGYLHHKLV